MPCSSIELRGRAERIDRTRRRIGTAAPKDEPAQAGYSGGTLIESLKYLLMIGHSVVFFGHLYHLRQQRN
jgi:hypothetical protein